MKLLLRYSVEASAVHGCMCVPEWLCCVSAPCSAIRQHPPTAFSEQNTVQLHQTAGDRQDQQGAAVIKEFMSKLLFLCRVVEKQFLPLLSWDSK